MNSINRTRSLRFRTLFPILAILFVLISGLVQVVGGNNRVQAVTGGTTVNEPDPYPFLGLMHASTTIRGAFSHTVLSKWCGATLIASQWALTAEHCLYYSSSTGLFGLFHSSGLYQVNDITVTFGSTLSDGSGGTSRSVSNVLVERSIDLNAPSNKNKSEAQLFDKNDLALLKLSSPIEGPLTVGGIAPVTVGDYCPSRATESSVLAAGWGQGREANDNLPPLNTMQEATLNFEGSLQSIEAQAPGEYVFTSERLGHLMFGDSGNGLLFKEPNGQYVLLGVLHAFKQDADTSNAVWSKWERTDATSANFSFIKPYLQTTPVACPPSTSPAPQPPPIQQSPTVPTGLHVTGRTTSSVSIAWNAVPGTTGYRVYNNGTQIAQVTGTNATVTGLKDNTNYTFTVVAYNGAGQSAQSVPLTVQTLPSWRFAVLSQNVYDDAGKVVDLGHLRPGQHGRIVITVRNTGSATWTNSGANPVMLGTDHPRDRASAIMTSGWTSSSRPAYLSETQVAPGGQGTFAFPFAAPKSAGTVTEYFTPVAQGLSWFDDVGLYLRFTVVPVVGVAFTPGTDAGQWVAAADGGVFAYSGAGFYGSMASQHLNQPVVGIAATSTGKGYWLVAGDGGVFAYGDASYYGSMAGHPLNQSVVGITATPTGKGYWLAAGDGGVFAFGDAGYYGSMNGHPLNQPVVGIVATPTGKGYWLAAGDGGVFAYGDASYYGSMAGHPLNQPVVGIAATPTGKGYWLAAGDGGVFAYGDASYYGSMGAGGASRPIIGITTTPHGYYLVDVTGAVQSFNSPQAPSTHDTLNPQQQLNPGDQLVSSNGRYVLVMQGDGNLVEYVTGGQAVWASGTSVPGTVFINQADGNFVLIAPGNHPVWATGTNAPGTVLTVQDDGNVVAYAPGHRAIWATNTSV